MRFPEASSEKGRVAPPGSGDPCAQNEQIKARELAEANEALNLAKKAKWPELFEFLRNHPAIIDIRPPSRRYHILHHAAYAGDVKVVQTLVETFGADTSVLTSNGEDARTIAHQRHHDDVKQYLSNMEEGVELKGRVYWSKDRCTRLSADEMIPCGRIYLKTQSVSEAIAKLNSGALWQWDSGQWKFDECYVFSARLQQWCKLKCVDCMCSLVNDMKTGGACPTCKIVSDKCGYSYTCDDTGHYYKCPYAIARRKANSLID